VGENGSGKIDPSRADSGGSPAAGHRQLAFPDAQIYSFDRTPLEVVSYDDLDQVRITRDFLNAPARYLSQILQDKPPLH
jgi:hypothetical protein